MMRGGAFFFPFLFFFFFGLFILLVGRGEKRDGEFFSTKCIFCYTTEEKKKGGRVFRWVCMWMKRGVGGKEKDGGDFNVYI